MSPQRPGLSQLARAREFRRPLRNFDRAGIERLGLECAEGAVPDQRLGAQAGNKRAQCCVNRGCIRLERFRDDDVNGQHIARCPTLAFSFSRRLLTSSILVDILPPPTIATSGRLGDENSGEYSSGSKKAERLLWH
jgi:hypothetical protein